MAREGKSYTVDTLAPLLRQYPDDELLASDGDGYVLPVPGLDAPEEICGMRDLCAFVRIGKATRRGLCRAGGKYSRARFRQPLVNADAADRVIEVSSTELRAGMASGASGCDARPRGLGYILREHLIRNKS